MTVDDMLSTLESEFSLSSTEVYNACAPLCGLSLPNNGAVDSYLSAFTRAELRLRDIGRDQVQVLLICFLLKGLGPAWEDFNRRLLKSDIITQPSTHDSTTFQDVLMSIREERARRQARDRGNRLTRPLNQTTLPESLKRLRVEPPVANASSSKRSKTMTEYSEASSSRMATLFPRTSDNLGNSSDEQQATPLDSVPTSASTSQVPAIVVDMAHSDKRPVDKGKQRAISEDSDLSTFSTSIATARRPQESTAALPTSSVARKSALYASASTGSSSVGPASTVSASTVSPSTVSASTDSASIVLASSNSTTTGSASNASKSTNPASNGSSTDASLSINAASSGSASNTSTSAASRSAAPKSTAPTSIASTSTDTRFTASATNASAPVVTTSPCPVSSIALPITFEDAGLPDTIDRHTPAAHSAALSEENQACPQNPCQTFSRANRAVQLRTARPAVIADPQLRHSSASSLARSSPVDNGSSSVSALTASTRATTPAVSDRLSLRRSFTSSMSTSRPTNAASSLGKRKSNDKRGTFVVLTQDSAEFTNPLAKMSKARLLALQLPTASPATLTASQSRKVSTQARSTTNSATPIVILDSDEEPDQASRHQSAASSRQSRQATAAPATLLPSSSSPSERQSSRLAMPSRVASEDGETFHKLSSSSNPPRRSTLTPSVLAALRQIGGSKQSTGDAHVSSFTSTSAAHSNEGKTLNHHAGPSAYAESFYTPELDDTAPSSYPVAFSPNGSTNLSDLPTGPSARLGPSQTAHPPPIQPLQSTSPSPVKPRYFPPAQSTQTQPAQSMSAVLSHSLQSASTQTLLPPRSKPVPTERGTQTELPTKIPDSAQRQPSAPAPRPNPGFITLYGIDDVSNVIATLEAAGHHALSYGNVEVTARLKQISAESRSVNSGSLPISRRQRRRDKARSKRLQKSESNGLLDDQLSK